MYVVGTKLCIRRNTNRSMSHTQRQKQSHKEL